MTSENGSERADRVSAKNYNGTYDYGCFQVNSIHEKEWKTIGASIFDPVVNSKMALVLFQRRGNFSAWYAVCTPKKVAKKPGIWCK